jgi:5-methylcytosine-specific restriction endonuclease McrA
MACNKRMFGRYASEDISDSERRCVFCGEVKSLTDFPKNGTNPDGTTAYRLDCKVCYNIRRKENKAKKYHSDFIGGQKRRGEAEPRLSHQEWKEVMLFFGGACAYCGCTPRRSQRLTRDHLEPVSNGGTTTQDNIVPACASCNSSKGAEDFKRWFMRQPFFSQERLNRIFKWRTILRQVGGE